MSSHFAEILKVIKHTRNVNYERKPKCDTCVKKAESYTEWERNMLSF